MLKQSSSIFEESSPSRSNMSAAKIVTNTSELVHKSVQRRSIIIQCVVSGLASRVAQTKKREEPLTQQQLLSIKADFGLEIKEGKAIRVQTKRSSKVMDSWPDVAAIIQQCAKQSPASDDSSSLRKLLKDLGVFQIIDQELTLQEINELCKHCGHLFAPKGQTLCVAGAKDEFLYIILRGKVALAVPRQQDSQTLKNQATKPKARTESSTPMTAPARRKAVKHNESFRLNQNLTDEAVDFLATLNSFSLAQPHKDAKSLQDYEQNDINKVATKGLSYLQARSLSSWNKQESLLPKQPILKPELKRTSSVQLDFKSILKIVQEEKQQSPVSERSLDKLATSINSSARIPQLAQWQEDLRYRGGKHQDEDSEISPRIDSNREDCYGHLFAGDIFGMMGVLEGQPKAMTATCVQNTHCLTIQRCVIEQVQKAIKTRQDQERIAFLKELPLYKHTSQSKIKGIINQFKTQSLKRGHVLFAEGQPAQFVYIVAQGEFKVFKKVNRTQHTDNTEAIFQDPLRVKRLTSEFDIRNSQLSYESHVLELVQKNQFLAVEDVVNQNLNHSVTAVCESSEAEVFKIARSDFIKIKSNDMLWKKVKQQVNTQLDKFCSKILQNQVVSADYKESLLNAYEMYSPIDQSRLQNIISESQRYQDIPRLVSIPKITFKQPQNKASYDSAYIFVTQPTNLIRPLMSQTNKLETTKLAQRSHTSITKLRFHPRQIKSMETTLPKARSSSQLMRQASLFQSKITQ